MNNEIHTYSGNCHCGKVSFSFKATKITTGLVCNCSICKRKGATMSKFVLTAKDLDIKGRQHLGMYQFDTNIAKHYFCTSCGIYPFHETARTPGSYRVNLGCVDDIDIYNLHTTMFDGKHLL